MTAIDRDLLDDLFAGLPPPVLREVIDAACRDIRSLGDRLLAGDATAAHGLRGAAGGVGATLLVAALGPPVALEAVRRRLGETLAELEVLRAPA